jgi:hypothetical protein
MTLYSALICWLIFNELFILAILRKSSPFATAEACRETRESRQKAGRHLQPMRNEHGERPT